MYKFNFDGAKVTPDIIVIPFAIVDPSDPNAHIVTRDPAAKLFIELHADETLYKNSTRLRIRLPRAQGGNGSMDCPREYENPMWDALLEWMNSTKFFRGWREVYLASWSHTALVNMMLCLKEAREIERREKVLMEVWDTGILPKNSRGRAISELFETMNTWPVSYQANSKDVNF